MSVHTKTHVPQGRLLVKFTSFSFPFASKNHQETKEYITIIIEL